MISAVRFVLAHREGLDLTLRLLNTSILATLLVFAYLIYSVRPPTEERLVKAGGTFSPEWFRMPAVRVYGQVEIEDRYPLLVCVAKQSGGRWTC